MTDELTALREKLAREERRSAALLVDADRREQRALALVPDCEAHGREIRHLRHMAQWCWDGMQAADAARGDIVTDLLTAASRLEKRTDDIPAAEVARVLNEAVGAQRKAMGRKGFPSLADCQRAGECDHEFGEGFRAGIAELLGLSAGPVQETLFGEAARG